MRSGSVRVKEHTHAKSTPGTNGTPKPKPPPKRDHDAYCDLTTGKYFLRQNGEFISLKEEALGRVLRARGFTREGKLENSLSYLEAEYMRIQLEEGVVFAGELGGYPAGEYTICGNRCLVTRGPTLPKPKAGPFPVLGKFLGQLLPGDAKGYFLGWLRAARRSLGAGPPWGPGQALVLCGPAGCGKNLLQSIITEILGGRVGKPYRYMSGETSFNRDLLSAEHLAIQDEVEHPDYKARRFFAARIKDFTVNELQSFHPKGRDAFNLTPFWRLSISLNEEVENLQILPPLERGVEDKLMLFRCAPTVLPLEADDPARRGEFRARLSAELPGFLHWLRRWKMPERMKSQRYGVAAYHEPTLVAEINSLSPEAKLWALIEHSSIIPGGLTGTLIAAAEIERRLREEYPRECEALLRWPNACGMFLEKLSHKYPERIIRERGPENTRLWKLLPAVHRNGATF